MILSLKNLEKSIFHKDLLKDFSMSLQEGEHAALIGSNGTGKTTLLGIINGDDADYKGEIEMKKNLKIIVTRQEHFEKDDLTAMDYILKDVPKYIHLKAIINTDTEIFIKDTEKVQEYSDAVIEFAEKNYYTIEDDIVKSLESFNMDLETAFTNFNLLSGGEKRFVELVRTQFSQADLILIDEPTNHMDYVGKELFLQWLKNNKQTILVVTHDRDVLLNVEKIIELKDGKAKNFRGNYKAYITQNSINTVTDIGTYESKLIEMEKAKKQMIAAKVRKLKAKSDPGRVYAKNQEEHFRKIYEDLQEKINKPSFWIDQESIENMSDVVVEKYEKYKQKNIKIKVDELNENKKSLLKIKNLSLGFSKPLFNRLNFTLFHDDRLLIKGRNGAGKSTLLRYIISIYENQIPESKLFEGEVSCAESLRIGIYEQEINRDILSLGLKDSIYKFYNENKIMITEDKVKSLMSHYLFHPVMDANLLIKNMSGGQKARLQIIKMFSNSPNLLILDEPTNHLDLASIEELEKTLNEYSGAILYVTHDSFFSENLGGNIILI